MQSVPGKRRVSVRGMWQPHSTLLYESIADGQAAAVYEAPFVPEVNLMMMLQIIDVVDHMSRKVPATVMWDSGANLTMITAEFSQRLGMLLGPLFFLLLYHILYYNHGHWVIITNIWSTITELARFLLKLTGSIPICLTYLLHTTMLSALFFTLS